METHKSALSNLVENYRFTLSNLVENYRFAILNLVENYRFAILNLVEMEYCINFVAVINQMVNYGSKNIQAQDICQHFKLEK